MLLDLLLWIHGEDGRISYPEDETGIEESLSVRYNVRGDCGQRRMMLKRLSNCAVRHKR